MTLAQSSPNETRRSSRKNFLNNLPPRRLRRLDILMSTQTGTYSNPDETITSVVGRELESEPVQFRSSDGLETQQNGSTECLYVVVPKTPGMNKVVVIPLDNELTSDFAEREKEIYKLFDSSIKNFQSIPFISDSSSL